MSSWLVALSVIVALRMVATATITDDQIRALDPRVSRRKGFVWGAIYLFLIAMGAG